jgi:oxygen-independent coproporphyrinogen III oxidase
MYLPYRPFRANSILLHMEISLYIHVPFCGRKCGYCDFYSVPYEDVLADEYVTALVKEWSIVSKDLGLENAVIKTVFCGGGTPSLLSVAQWQKLRSSLMQHMDITHDAEWTIECNPDSFDGEKAELWRSMGVTRLTFGIQSLDEKELKWLGRIHSAEQATRALDSPILRIFSSIGADLMYGIPRQTAESFLKSIGAILSRPVIKHLSAYELTICKDTPFATANLPLPDEDGIVVMTKALFTTCRERGFERYEISNFAKAGHRCRHNEAYWNHSPYIGLGPAAHSYVHSKRWANAGDIKKYLTMINGGKRAVDFEETIDKATLTSEMIFLRLRTADGLDEEVFQDAAGEAFYSGARRKILDGLLNDALIVFNGTKWRLTEDGIMIGDEIARRLI